MVLVILQQDVASFGQRARNIKNYQLLGSGAWQVHTKVSGKSKYNSARTLTGNGKRACAY